MPDFETLFSGLKNDIGKLAKDTVGEFADQAENDANKFIDTVKEDLRKWGEQFATGQIDKDMLEYLLNTDQGLGQMKLQTQIGLAKIKADSFIIGVKNIVLDTLIKLAETVL